MECKQPFWVTLSAEEVFDDDARIEEELEEKFSGNVHYFEYMQYVRESKDPNISDAQAQINLQQRVSARIRKELTDSQEEA